MILFLKLVNNKHNFDKKLFLRSNANFFVRLSEENFYKLSIDLLYNT